MQKIQSYLYPNRVRLLADLAGFTVENKVVYARTIKLFNGIDNVIEFDIQNADQKRIDLSELTDLNLNLMDSEGHELTASPYALTLYSSASATVATVVGTTSKSTTTTITIPTANVTGAFSVNSQLNGTDIVGAVIISGVTEDVDSETTTLSVTYASQTVSSQTVASVNSTVKGLATLTVPKGDLADLAEQFLKYSITAKNDAGDDVILYNDSYFSAVGTIQLINNAMPKDRRTVVYDRFSGEINFMGNVINHSSAIPCKLYEAVPATSLSITVNYTGFIGQIYVEGTNESTISVESFRNAEHTQIISTTTKTTGTTTVQLDINDFNYVRVSWVYPDVWQHGTEQTATLIYGSVDKVTVSYG